MKTIVISGSGLSVESGIPTFAGSDGLYDGFDASTILTPETLRREPQRIHSICDTLRTLTRNAVPHTAHRELAAFEQRNNDVLHFTQNVDDLLERSGCANVVHLHGLITRMRCLGRDHRIDIGFEREPTARCSRCASRLRPDVVLFGEPAPAYRTLRKAIESAAPQDVLIVVGTRGAVVPVSQLVRAFRGRRALVNREPSPFIDDSRFDVVRYGLASREIGVVVEWIEAQKTA